MGKIFGLAVWPQRGVRHGCPRGNHRSFGESRVWPLTSRYDFVIKTDFGGAAEERNFFYAAPIFLNNRGLFHRNGGFVAVRHDLGSV